MADHNEDTSWLATSELRIEDLVDLDLYDHSESSREIQAPHIRAYDELMLERRATRVGAHEEYPRTDSDGYAYIVYLDTSDPEKLRTKEVHDRMRDIQYCKKVVGTSQVVYSSYLNCQTLRTDLRCTGAKVCQYLGSQLRDFQHSHVNEELWDSIQETRASIEDARTLTHSQRQAIALVDAAKKRFAQRKACRSHTQTCHLVFREGRPEGVDFEYMRQLCTNTAEFAYEDCAVVEQQVSRKTTCGLFLRSPELRDFCKSYRGETLSQIHASFANYDRIRALILKQRILAYPEGRDLKGVYWKYTNDPEWREYTRGIYNVPYNDGVIILCALDSQIKLLASVKSFEVDMSYKRTKGEFNEVIFAMFHEKHGKVITLARAFVNRQDKYTYKKLFEVLFERVETVTGFPIRFYYLYGEGLRAIVMDMDQELEPRFFDWAEHKAHEVIAAGLCKACSLIRPEFWDEVQNSTNAVEQSHNKSYSMGKYETLLGAIQGSRILDQRDMDQYTARERHDLRHGYRSADIRSRYANHMTNERK
ncbi:hypothetical protein PENSUB_5331 [Penicillium subrubescens]|uniref:MULE transposase domain-containing protein n=1 Tax=Penicillium subrubescens TaxID=1316194 RepID=A0A1Q5UA39_9EURO|nr:hypothetical protein PENSUB_5331 [Penicillium subrubescens]